MILKNVESQPPFWQKELKINFPFLTNKRFLIIFVSTIDFTVPLIQAVKKILKRG